MAFPRRGCVDEGEDDLEWRLICARRRRDCDRGIGGCGHRRVWDFRSRRGLRAARGESAREHRADESGEETTRSNGGIHESLPVMVALSRLEACRSRKHAAFLMAWRHGGRVSRERSAPELREPRLPPPRARRMLGGLPGSGPWAPGGEDRPPARGRGRGTQWAAGEEPLRGQGAPLLLNQIELAPF